MRIDYSRLRAISITAPCSFLPHTQRQCPFTGVKGTYFAKFCMRTHVRVRQKKNIGVIQCNLFSVTVVRWFVVSWYQSHDGKEKQGCCFCNCISALVDSIQQRGTLKNWEGGRKRGDMGWRLKTKFILLMNFRRFSVTSLTQKRSSWDQ